MNTARRYLAHVVDVLVHYGYGRWLEAQVNEVIETDECDFLSNGLAGIMTGF